MAIWMVVNTVYFNDGSGEIYGYKIKDEASAKRRIISSQTADRLTAEGKLRVLERQELSFCSVERGYVEKELDGLAPKEGADKHEPV
ncbi:hypothetical protein [Paenibacillus silvae]|uniref:DUF3892 domain-containing protein n=1 Tax=Paenibacillus silvae TaxID=1325358 RepID=A0A2W6N7Z4_9BACL|nr:hypothetical protein [Paenibacillus silvae]PZT52004.1 hypothetical protein DN757_29710 [Paenibacillus silvae]